MFRHIGRSRSIHPEVWGYNRRAQWAYELQRVYRNKLFFIPLVQIRILSEHKEKSRSWHSKRSYHFNDIACLKLVRRHTRLFFLLRLYRVFAVPKVTVLFMCDCILDWVTDIHVSNDSAEQSHSSESNICSASEEVPRILRIPKVHYRVHNSPPRVLYLCQMKPLHVLPILPTEGPPLYALVLKMVSSPQVSVPKACKHLSSYPYALHVPPTTQFRVW